MIETIVISLFVGIIGGLFSYGLLHNSGPKIIRMKTGYIRYIEGYHTDFITVVDKMGNELIDAGIARDKNGVNRIKYAVKL